MKKSSSGKNSISNHLMFSFVTRFLVTFFRRETSISRWLRSFCNQRKLGSIDFEIKFCQNFTKEQKQTKAQKLVKVQVEFHGFPTTQLSFEN